MNTLNVVESVFFAALEKDTPEARAAYLDEACRADDNLRRCVERLLNAHPKAEDFLRPPAPVLPPTREQHSLVEKPGSVIGPYKLLQELGEGGFGVVFLAEQTEPVRRKVALKIIKPGMDSKQVIARFEAERQALALMDHPNIARVLDAGMTGVRSQGSGVRNDRAADSSPTPDLGRPYFVMELVKGVPITEFCDQNRLTPRQRLELFVPVCQAIQHAHQKGIIHRDLKPSNVLVTLYDDKPVPKVIDFGVAKAIEQKLTEQTLFTKIGQVIGTLEYMSPEQASLNALDVDTRSDIYALGVLLYELLTGSTPLDKERVKGAAFLETLRLIREEEPPRPSTRLSQSGQGLPLLAAYRKTESHRLPKLVRGELDWIAMKALDKDRSRRYATANALARDVQRYLSDEAVEACPPSAAYRLRKYIRKHKAAFATCGTIAALLILATAISSWQAVRAMNATSAARAAETAAAQDRDAALESESTALAAEITAARDRDAAKDSEQKALDESIKAKAAGQQARDAEAVAKTETADAQTARDELRGILYAAHLNLVQAAWDVDNITRVQELLEQHRPAPGETDERGFEWRYWQRQCHRELSTVKLPAPQGPNAAFSGDGRLMAGTGSGSHELIRVWDTATGKQLHEFPFAKIPGPGGPLGGVSHVLGFSADGKRLICAQHRLGPNIDSPVHRDAEIKIWNLANGKELGTIKGELDIISWSSVALSPDGTRLACHTIERDADNKVTGRPLKVWEMDTGKEVLSIPQTQQPLMQVAFSPDGKDLATALRTADAEVSPSVVVQLWDAATGQEHSAIKTSGSTLTAMVFSPDASRLVTLSQRFVSPRADFEPPEVTLWDVATGKKLVTFRENSSALINSMVFSPDGKLLSLWNGLSTLSPSPTIRLWDTATGEVRFTLKGHTSGVQCVAFNGDGTRLHSAAVDGTLKTWAIPATDTALNPTQRPRLGSGPVVVSRDGTRYLVPSTAKDEKGIRVVDAAAHKELCVFREHKGAVQNAVFSPDGKRIASVALLDDEDKTVEVKVWDAFTGKVALALELTEFKVREVTLPASGPGLAPRKVLDGVPDVVFNSNGTLIALNQRTSSSAKEKRVPVVKVWDIARDKEVFATDKKTGFPGAVHFSPDGKRLLAAGEGSAGMKVLDAVTYRELVTLEGEGAPTTIEVDSADESVTFGNLVFNRDGSRVANFCSVKREVDGRKGVLLFVNVWDMTTGKQWITVPVSPIWAVALSPDGRYVAASRNPGPRIPGEVVVLDLEAHRDLFALQGHTQPVAALAFSPDGRRIASMATIPGNGPQKIEVKIWDAATGHELLKLSSALRVRSPKLFFSPDGSRLIATGRPQYLDEEPLIIWDATPLQELAPPAETTKETIRSWGDAIDPVGDCTFKASDGKLTITVPGTDHDLTKVDPKAPRVLQAVEGDFTIQVRVTGDFDPGKESAIKGTSFNGAGLLLWIDHENYVRLERNIYIESKSGSKVLSYPPLFEYWRNGKRMRTGPLPSDDPFFKGRSTYLRLERRAGTLVASVSHDGTEWITLPPLRIELPKTFRVGVDAVNTSIKPFVVEFEELKLTTK